MDTGPITEETPSPSVKPLVNTIVKTVKDELGAYFFLPIVLIIIFLVLNLIQTGLLLRLLKRE